jgi:MFS transporter, DHA3 family, macrolide efflux protein
VLIAGIVFGLLLGIAAGGSLWNLAAVRLTRLTFIAAAVLVRFGTEAAIGGVVPFADDLRLLLYASAYALLLVGLWPNRWFPGISLAFVGIFANAIAIVANGGHMPIWEPSLVAAGIPTPEIHSAFHVVLPATLDVGFLLHAGPFADVIPIPIPYVRNVASVGDLFVTSGLAFFLFATVLRTGDGDQGHLALKHPIWAPRVVPGGHGALTTHGESRIRSTTPRTPGALVVATEVGRDVLRPLGSDPIAIEAAVAAGTLDAVTGERPARKVAVRAKRHPYVRLALNGSFSALWMGQLISLFGDRVHQIAVVVLVAQATGSPVAVAGIFISATIPNLLLSPVAGTFVDRWDHHDVLVVSDLLRASLVLVIPAAAVSNLLLLYPLTFLVACVSVFFRPARVAVLPRIVEPDELTTANSLLWTAETLADIVGFPVAGLFVAFLATSLPLAFWFDAATYIASAALLWTIVVPAMDGTREAAATTGRNFRAELVDGWRFLRHETVLLANTIQAIVGQFMLGAVNALLALYIVQMLHPPQGQSGAWYGLLVMGIGLGNLLGGFVLGWLGPRIAKGRAVIAGYAAAGICVALLGTTGNLATAFVFTTGAGVANMVFVLPSQTLFQTRTPADLIGRVVGFRFALVFGAMTIAMASGALLAAVIGVGQVFVTFGLLTLVAGLAGLLVPAVRDA